MSVVECKYTERKAMQILQSDVKSNFHLHSILLGSRNVHSFLVEYPRLTCKYPAKILRNYLYSVILNKCIYFCSCFRQINMQLKVFLFILEQGIYQSCLPTACVVQSSNKTSNSLLGSSRGEKERERERESDDGCLCLPLYLPYPSVSLLVVPISHRGELKGPSVCEFCLP